MDWEAAQKREDLTTVQGQIFQGIRRMLEIRRNCAYFRSDLKSTPVDLDNPAVFGFHKENKMMVLANFSEQEQWVDADRFSWFTRIWFSSSRVSGQAIPSVYAFIGSVKFIIVRGYLRITEHQLFRRLDT